MDWREQVEVLIVVGVVVVCWWDVSFLLDY